MAQHPDSELEALIRDHPDSVPSGIRLDSNAGATITAPAATPTPPPQRVAQTAPATATDATADNASSEYAHLSSNEQQAAVTLAGSLFLKLQGARFAAMSDEDIAALPENNQEAIRDIQSHYTDETLTQHLDHLKSSLLTQLLDGRSFENPEAAGITQATTQAQINRYVTSIESAIANDPNADLEHVVQDAAQAAGFDFAEDGLAQSEKAYLEEVKKHREALHLREALAQHAGTASPFSALALALEEMQNPPLDSKLSEVMKETPNTVHRGLTHINKSVGFRDPTTGQQVQLSQPELDRASMLVSAIYLQEASLLANRWSGLLGDASYRAGDIVEGGRGIINGATSAIGDGISAGLNGTENTRGVPTDAGFQDHIQHIGRLIGDFADPALDAAGNAIQDEYAATGERMTMRHLHTSMMNTYELMASAMPGTQMNRYFDAVNNARTLEPAVVAYLRETDPNYYSSLVARTAAMGRTSFKEGDIALSLIVDDLGGIANGAVGSAAYAMTGAIPNAARNHQQTQIPMSVAMYGATDITQTMTIADLMADGDYPLNARMVDKYAQRGLAVQAYGGAPAYAPLNHNATDPLSPPPPSPQPPLNHGRE